MEVNGQLPPFSSLFFFFPSSTQADTLMLDAQPDLSNLKAPKKPPSGAVVGESLAPLSLPSKAESVVSITSQCSYSSTIVHVGDKKPQPESGLFKNLIYCNTAVYNTHTWNTHMFLVIFVWETCCICLLLYPSEIIEDVAESPVPPTLPGSMVSPPSQEKEAYKKLGLTKQVLAAHTQKEEQAFLSRCRGLRSARSLQKDYFKYLHQDKGTGLFLQ